MANFYSATKKVKKFRKQQVVTIESLDQSLTGIAHVDNKVVFVPGSLPQENVVIQIVDEHKTYAKATLVSIEDNSKLRIDPQCEHFTICGGCQVQYLSNDDQLSLKESALQRRFSFAASKEQWQDAISSQPWHYRRRARIGVNVEKNKELRVGFRQRGSNDIINIKQCNVLTAPFDNIFQPLFDLIDPLEAREKIGHVEIIATPTHNVALFRCLKKLSVDDQEKINQFSKVHNLVVLIEDNDGGVFPLDANNNVTLSYPMADYNIEFEPGNFIQVNSGVNERMVARAIDWLDLKSTDKVLDLFCGVGNFSIAIAKKAQLVVGVEGIKEMALQGTKNAVLANIDNAVFYHSNLSQPLNEQQWFGSKLRKKVDKILLDPAREGALEICRQLSQLQPSKIVYVSCDPASLERDSKVIIEQGYRLDKMCAMDMFPQTTHVESMALFVKAPKKVIRVKKRLG
jgi:23S rRNA (uracil1939-C5)-methyltransferase